MQVHFPQYSTERCTILIMVTRRGHYQRETKAVQKNTNMLVLQIDCSLIYLNHIKFSIAMRWYTKLHPNPKPLKDNKNIRNVSVYATSLAFGSNGIVYKSCCVCQQYLFPLFSFICMVSKKNLNHLLS